MRQKVRGIWDERRILPISLLPLALSLINILKYKFNLGDFRDKVMVK